jgi:hypothetical protein
MSEQYVPIQLPSKCLAYDNVDASKIVIRTFKGSDEQLITELNIDNIKKKFLSIIAGVIKGIEPGKLTSGDAKHIMLWEAINSYDQYYPITIMCEECLQKINITADMGKIDSKELPDDFKQPVEVKLSDRVVKLKLLTLDDEIAALDYEKQTGSSYLYNLALSIVDELPAIGRMKVLEDMKLSDLNKIKKFQMDYTHGPDMIAPYKCPQCGFEGKLVLPFRFDKLFSFSA